MKTISLLSIPLILSILTIGALAFTIQQSADLLNASNKINSNETNERSNQISLQF